MPCRASVRGNTTRSGSRVSVRLYPPSHHESLQDSAISAASPN